MPLRYFLSQGVDGFVCTLQATVGKYPPPESLLKSAVKYVRGESSTDYCKTAKGVLFIAHFTYSDPALFNASISVLYQQRSFNCFHS